MADVVPFTAAQRAPSFDASLVLAAALLSGRHVPEDVYWLKENAEFLRACVACGVPLSPQARALYASVQAELPARLRFFPQYYRFFLSIAQDLEALGLAPGRADAMCRWITSEGLPDAELSDLQRAEARLMLTRSGAAICDEGLSARLHDFSARSATFALPNRKAAYELTHVVFYLSDYGRRDPDLGKNGHRSLLYAGTLAFLDQDADLLAECCIALRQARLVPPAAWEDWLSAIVQRSHVCANGGGADAFHTWLMLRWALTDAGKDSLLPRSLPSGHCLRFVVPGVGGGPLRALSSELLRMGPLRSARWAAMRAPLFAALDSAGRAVLTLAEVALDGALPDGFEEFFSHFARAGALPR